MSTPDQPSTDLVQRSSMDLIMSDDEMRRTYRVGEALAASGVWKDIKKAEAAFAKIVIGRDLGMTPAQSMQGIHLVEGAIQMHYATLGMFIRARKGYDYRAGWIKVDQLWGSFMSPDGELLRGHVLGEYADNNGSYFDIKVLDGAGEFVANRRVPQTAVRLDRDVSIAWLDEDDPLDLRPVFGAVVVATVDGEQRGVSTYTEDDARQAGLIKESPKAAWNTSRRNMLLARAMSNLVKWSIPEVMNGMPVYTPGEIPESRASRSLTAGTEPEEGAADQGKGIDLGPKVEALIAEAAEVGHRGLSNRAAVEMAVGMRAPGAVNEWMVRARAELDRFKAAKAEAATADEASITAGDPEEEAVHAPEEVVQGEAVVETPEPGTQDTQQPETVVDAEPVDDPAARLQHHIENDPGADAE